jgi:uncharacterized membrane protein
MKLQNIEKKVENEYHVSWYIILYKLTLGIVELLAGIGLALFGSDIMRFYLSYSARELSEDPHDILIRFSEGIVPQLFTHNTYLIFYLILLGMAKIAGSIGLVYKQNWGADLLVGLTVLLLPFQLVNLILHPSLFDVVYIFLGLFIALYLIEFRPKAWISKILIRYFKKYISIRNYSQTMLFFTHYKKVLKTYIKAASSFSPQLIAFSTFVSRRSRRFVWKIIVSLLLIGLIYLSSSYSASLPAQLADNVLRPILGNTKTLLLESWYFSLGDRMQQVRNTFKKPNSNIFTPDTIAISQTTVPNNKDLSSFNLLSLPLLINTKPLPSEGIWSTIPEPFFTNQIVMAKTFIRTDTTREYSIVSLVKINMQQLSLGMEAGTYYPGETKKLFGPGKVPKSIQDSNNLIAVFNGGFQKKDGYYGMIVGDKTYVPLRKGLATLLLTSDGKPHFIIYQGEKLGSNVIGVRQNGPFLIKNGVITSFNENGIDTWGRTTTNSMYTWRSGIGITKNGDLIYAVGNSLIPKTLAKALLDAGAVDAMQLDINPYWVRFIVYNSSGKGTYSFYPLLKNMHNGGYDYLHGYNKDFFFVYKK